MVRALATHQCGPGSNPGVDGICGLSLLLVLSLAQRGFSPGTPVFPSPRKTNISKFQFDQESANRDLFIIFIYFFIILKLLQTWKKKQTNTQTHTNKYADRKTGKEH